MANTALSHSDITSKFDSADLEEDIEIETEEGDAIDDEEEDGFEIVEKTIPNLDEPVPAADLPDQEESTPADEAVSPDAAPVEQPAKADQRCIEQKQHVPNCECTGSARSPF